MNRFPANHRQDWAAVAAMAMGVLGVALIAFGSFWLAVLGVAFLALGVGVVAAGYSAEPKPHLDALSAAGSLA